MEIEALRHSERIQVLELFSSIYSIGPTTARKLYALGLREIRHLEVYYEVDPSDATSQVARKHINHDEITITPERSSSGGRLGRDGVGGASEELGESWIKVALNLRDDLQLK